MRAVSFSFMSVVTINLPHCRESLHVGYSDRALSLTLVFFGAAVRHYDGLVDNWRRDRAAFQEQHFVQKGGGRLSYNYPEHLKTPLPKFSIWLRNHIRQLVHTDPQYPVSPELWALSSPSAQKGTSYQSMWAYSSHYQCCVDNDEDHVSYDSSIAGIFTQDCCSRADDENIQ